MPPLQTCTKISSSLLLLALLAAACARKDGAGPGDPASGEFGTVVLALTSIPGDVQCVRVTVTGNSTVARTFPVTPNQMNPPPVVMSGLPLGMATVYEEAFNVPCASLDANTNPTWVAQAPVPVTLAPNTQAMVTIVLRRPGGLQVGMEYQEGGGALSISPATGTFGSVPVGQSADLTFTVTNGGSTATGPIAVALSGVDVGHFQISQSSCLAPLAAGATCTVLVRFQPGSSGDKSASLLASASPGGSVTAPLTGAGLGAPLTISPTSQDFGAVTIGDASPNRTFTITNNSALAATTTITTIGAGTGPSPDPTDFIVTLACDETIPAGGSCTVWVRYIPNHGGAVSSTAALIVTGSIGGTPFPVSAQLSGTRLTDADIDLQFNDADAAETQHLGNVRAGTSVSLTRTVINNGQTATGPLVLNIGGANAAEFTLGAGTCGSVPTTTTTLAPGATCTVIVNHTGVAADLGTRTATLSVSSEGRGGTSGVLTLLAIATPATSVFIAPNPADLGAGLVGINPPAVTFTVTNFSGAATAPLVVAASHPSFSFITNNTCPPAAGLANGATCTFGLQYQPQSVDPIGFLRGTVTVTETAGAARVFTGGLFGRKDAGAALTINPASRDYGNVVLNTVSPSATFTVTNSGSVSTSALVTTLGGASASQFTLEGGTCLGSTLAPGATCTAVVAFAPSTTLGAHTATLTVNGSSGGPAVTAALQGTSVLTSLLLLTPSAANFGDVPVGSQSAPTTFTVSNRANAAPTQPLSLALTGVDPANFLITGNTCSNLSLPGGASCAFSVVFTPGAMAGVRNAAVNVSGAVTGASATLTGTGVAPGSLNITPSSRDFGSVVVGTRSPPFTFTVTNGTAASTPPLNTSLSNTADFVLGANTCAGAVLAPSASCTVTVTFAPVQPLGSKNGMLTVFSGGLMASATLLGSATQAALLTVSPGSANFGAVPVGSQSNPVAFTVTNPAASPPTMPLQISIGGANASSFIITGNGCGGISLAPGANCTLLVVFTAGVTPGDRNAILNVLDGLSTVTAPLTGTSVTGTTLSITPNMMASNIPIGSQTEDRILTITNTGSTTSGPLSLTLTGMDLGQWRIGTGGCPGAMLMPGASCTQGIRFVPTDTLGTRSANVSVSAGGALISAALNGTVVDWLRQDVGAVGIPGTYGRNGGEHTIEGGGADIYGTNDAFHYLYHPVSGDVTITARVKSIEATNPWSKAEVMIRASTATNSPYVGALVPGLPSNGYRRQYRTTAGSAALTSTAIGTGQPGVWLRVKRQGNTFTTFFSNDGTFFQPLATSVTVTMPANITVGLGVTSHTTAPNVTLATAVFDRVTITTTP